MSVTRRFVIAALSMLGLTSLASAENSISASKPTPAAIIRISGEVNDYSRDTLFRRFREAESAGAKTIILSIDTYGGMVTSALDMSRFIRGKTDIHTIAYIDNKAISAGSMIAVACDEIVMAPSSVLGDCAPIILDPGGGLQPLPAAERAKIQSPILSDFKESARRNHYDPLVVEAMVKVEVSVYLIQDAEDHQRIVDENDYKKLTADGKWKPVPDLANPVDGSDTLLTVGPDIAKRLGLSKGTATSAQDLAASRGLSIVADLTPGVGDYLVDTLNSSLARLILMAIFFISLYISLHAPGHGAAEALSIVALGLLVGVPMLTGYAQWWEVALIVLGLALCAFELLVFPGHGVSLGLGLIMVLSGLLLTFVGHGLGPHSLPSSHIIWPRLKNGLSVMVGAMVAAIVVGALIRPFLPKLPLFRKLILSETSEGRLPSAGTPLKAGEDVWPFVGTVGVAITDLRPGGVVQFPYGSDSRNADVVSVSGFTTAGTKVIVQEARGNRIVVRLS